MWLDHQLIDVVCPMAYTPDATVFASQIASVRADRERTAGVGGDRRVPLVLSQTIDNIETARRLGAVGIVLFSYDSITRAPYGTDYLSSVGRAAFTSAR